MCVCRPRKSSVVLARHCTLVHSSGGLPCYVICTPNISISASQVYPLSVLTHTTHLRTHFTKHSPTPCRTNSPTHPHPSHLTCPNTSPLTHPHTGERSLFLQFVAHANSTDCAYSQDEGSSQDKHTYTPH